MSSFFSPIIISGISGPTGPTGSTGPVGPIGPTGANVYGPTGSSIIGITLTSSKQLLFTFEDSSTKQSSSIVGATGPWQVRITGTGEGFTNCILSSSSQSSSINSELSTYGDSLTLKNFTTNTPETIGITLSDDDSIIIIGYFSPLGITFDATSLNELVIGATLSGLTSANITYYDKVTKSFDIKVDSYLEGITNVYPTDHSGDNMSRWDLDTDLYTIFQLRQASPVQPNKQINILSSARDATSRGISIIIPSGVTGTPDKIKFIINSDASELCLFPMSMNIGLSDKLDVVNMISVGKDTWYASYVLFANTSAVENNTQQTIFSIVAGANSPIISNGTYFAWFLANSGGGECFTPVLPEYERPCIPNDTGAG